MKIDSDDVILSTGTTFYANNGILGINLTSQGIDITEGYDGGVDWGEFTLEEKSEIAEYVIKLWRQWAVEPLIN